jgi:hypothetical protein
VVEAEDDMASEAVLVGTAVATVIFDDCARVTAESAKVEIKETMVDCGRLILYERTIQV